MIDRRLSPGQPNKRNQPNKPNKPLAVSVLAFQGDFAEHEEVLRSMGVTTRQVRNVDDMKGIDRLIIPGGESTVMAKFLDDTGVGKEIQKRVGDGSLAVYGTCAGAILLARKARGKHAPRTLNLIDIEIDRNAYGTQLQSFETSIKLQPNQLHKHNKPINVSFIRAPKFTKVGKSVEVLARVDRDPILVRSDRILAGTFHPEVRGNREIHAMFLTM